MRKKLNARRFNNTCEVKHRNHNDSVYKLIVSYGIEDDKIKEAFCASFKTGSDMMSLAIDASILLSRCLQYGDNLEDISRSLCEPNSIIGSIVRHGISVEKTLNETSLDNNPTTVSNSADSMCDGEDRTSEQTDKTT